MMVRTLALLLVALASTGCFWRKPKQHPAAATPPPPKQRPTVTPAPPPPKIETQPPSTNTPAIGTKLPDVPKPPQPKQPARKTRRDTPAPKPAEKLPQADPESLPDLPPAAPKLGELLTEAQRQDLIRQCGESIQRVRSSLDKLAGRTLSVPAAESVERVRVFLRQAEQARAREPQTALQLAQRAEVLIADVLKTVP